MFLDKQWEASHYHVFHIEEVKAGERMEGHFVLGHGIPQLLSEFQYHNIPRQGVARVRPKWVSNGSKLKAGVGHSYTNILSPKEDIQIQFRVQDFLETSSPRFSSMNSLLSRDMPSPP